MECGDDGCGGDCGDCLPDLVCTGGACVDPTGDLSVQLVYAGAAPLESVHVLLFDGTMGCAGFDPVQPWDIGFVAEKTVPDPSAIIEFSNLQAGADFTLAATATGFGGQLTASGCVQEVQVATGLQTEVELPLYQLALQVSGAHTTSHQLDLQGTLPDAAGQLLDMVVNLFYSPGPILIDLMKDIVSAYVGELVSDVAFSLFEDMLADVVSDWLLNNSPGCVQDLFALGQDLAAIAAYAELHSDCDLSQLQDDYSFEGTFDWTGLSVFWKLGCNPMSPDYDECGEYLFSIEQLFGSAVPIQLSGSQFIAALVEFDKLTLNEHSLQLSPGKLALLAINELILPAACGQDAVDLMSFTNGVVDCGAIADAMLESVLDAIGIDKGFIKTACETSVAIAVQPIQQAVDTLSADAHLVLQGECTLTDDNNDLAVDHFVNGSLWGHVFSAGVQGAAVTGTFVGDRVAP